MKTRTKKINAISSLTQDDKHILIWDFDNIDLHDVLKSLSKIQRYNALGEIYIFKSKNGYNALCLDKLGIKEVHHIKYYTRFDDYNHLKIGYKMGSWCWGYEEKKYETRLIVCDNWKNREQSNAHKIFLDTYFDVDDFKGKFDNFTNVLFESYTKDLI